MWSFERYYRRVAVDANNDSNSPLGYIDYYPALNRVCRYTPAGDLIDTSNWKDDFYEWFTRYRDRWTADPVQAYYVVDGDLNVDEGL